MTFNWNDFFQALGGTIGILVLLRYAYKIFCNEAEAQSIATWSMWTVLDALLFAITWKAGKPIWLPLGWTTGAFLVTVALWRSGGKWEWEKEETLSLACTTVATWIWLTHDARLGIIAGTAALIIAGFPLMINLIRMPVPSTFPVWFFTAVACTCTIIGSDRTLEGVFLASGSLTFNIALCIIVKRMPRWTEYTLDFHTQRYLGIKTDMKWVHPDDPEDKRPIRINGLMLRPQDCWMMPLVGG